MMFLWPLALLGALVALMANIVLQIQRENLARLRAVAYLARCRCGGCGEPFGLLECQDLRCVLWRMTKKHLGSDKTVVLEACCGCSSYHVQVAVQVDTVASLARL